MQKICFVICFLLLIKMDVQAQHHLLPEPVSAIWNKGYFLINQQTVIVTANDKEQKNLAALLNIYLKQSTGYSLKQATYGGFYTQQEIKDIISFPAAKSVAQTSVAIDWPRFMAGNDLVYDTLTTKWEEGAFTGNGLLGAMLYLKDKNSLRLEVGRTDVTDHRKNETSQLFANLFAKARLPIGHFELRPVGNIKKITARLDLWNAEIRGVIVTDKGTIEWKTLTLSQTNVIVFETKVSGYEKDFAWQFFPEQSLSSRVKFTAAPAGYTANPPAVFGKEDKVDYCRQPFSNGGDYVTAWFTQTNALSKTYFITVAINKQSTSVADAIKTLQTAGNSNLKELTAVHRKYWHRYYPESFVSFPDTRIQGFYWAQQYKLASATRQGKPPIDLMGPWFRYTPWPAYWFNLNIQLTYSPLFAANHLLLSEGLVKMIDDGKENLIRNVPEEYRHNAAALGRTAAVDLYSPLKVFSNRDTTAGDASLELGNLTWVLHSYWLQYRYSMDAKLKENLFPILKRSINYYLAVMNKEEDGKWHLPYTYSPEYSKGVTRDCNYDLSLLRWGCETLLKLNDNDELAPVWKDVLQNLVSYPTDGNGLRIGRDVAFNQSHRHYSHLLMIYPLYTMNWEQPENRNLIEKSLNHWHSFKGALQGYSFTGGASMYAMMGNGDKALACLNQLFDRYVKPNTMYLETGPVIETALAAAASTQELFLQSWGDKIRVFPAVPSSWKDAAFHNMRTEGAFLISAVRKDGETKWIKIKSLAGEPCIIKPSLNGTVKIKGNAKLKMLGTDLYEVQLKKGEEVTLYKNEADLLVPVAAVKQSQQLNYWGKKKTN